jgi:4'-phosphopantetheinyl transferase
MLGADDCHIWCADVSASMDKLPLWERSLSPSERIRAAKFQFSEDRRAYVARHGILRHILAEYLAITPSKICFAYDAKGKPRIHPSTNDIDLRFSVSRSAHVVIIAVVRNCEIGVDVEVVRDLPDWEWVAEWSFSQRELNVLHDLPMEQRPGALLQGWTRKEAILKCSGDGIVSGTRHVEICLNSSDSPCLDGSMGRPCWDLRDFVPVPGFAAAVAIEQVRARVSYRTWMDSNNLPFTDPSWPNVVN